jgi:hypothetical protein
MPVGNGAPVGSKAMVELIAVAVALLSKSFKRTLAIAVAAVPAGFVASSLTGTTVGFTGVLTVAEQAGAVPVHSGSPPPVAVTAFTPGLVAGAAMVIGTVITMLPIATPVAMLQPASVLAPTMVGAAHVITAPVAVGKALSFMPVGNTSASVIGAVVALPATLMVMVYDWPVAPTISGVTLAVLVTVSLVATTAVDTVPVHAGAEPVHNGSPPPVAVTLLMLGLSADAATFTGTVMTILPKPAGEAIVHPAKVLPLIGQPTTAAPAAGMPVLVLVAAITGAPLKVMPVGKMSSNVIAEVVGLPATVMVMR